RNQVKPFALGQHDRMFPRCLEVSPMFDQGDAECPDRDVFLPVVTMRNHDRCAHSGLPGGEAYALAVITSRRSDHTAHFWISSSQVIEIHQPAPNLEGAG